MEFDAILFGNGLTLCYQKQMQIFIPNKYKHALFFDDYIEALINNDITPREENNIKKMFKAGYIYSFDVLINELAKTKGAFCKGFEWTWGKMLTDPSSFSKYKIVIDCLPVLYNLWYCNLKSLIVDRLGLQGTMTSFAQSLQKYLRQGGRVFTTNFDGFFDSISPEHIHGHFVEDLSNYKDFSWHKISNDDFYYPFIWAPADGGKMKMIEVFKQIKTNDKFFDFDFFHQTFFSKNMLVFGMSFTRAGYMEGLEEYDSKYRKLSFGSCIDDHILVRLRTLQEKGNLNNISFAYYDDISKQHYKRVISDFQLNANLIPSSEFDFHI